MPYSTGRGGAGNIQSSPSISSHQHESTDSQPRNPISPSSSQEGSGHKKIYYSTGRGGAGNIQKSDSAPSPKLVPQGSNTPKLHTDKVSTGRGGYGNMVSNDDPELTRKLQDVDGPSKDDLHAVASNKSFSVGRGGFGNVISKTRSGASSQGLSENHLYTITSHGEKLKKDKKKGIFGKIKEVFNT
ncbi:uncharacterized protein CANTADRAFT_90931 [Suhomyces tanzawaensis NRRL Y-17324]|uniref:Uncharacterized protein n=1 Tax=Suhomyces tanzawaensis NRRL Y-17324 TaxID=984487 RepID=A0A1E4SGM6_9ASCO|nr:uncharacterized protein CANTADRAFT_90931 [Suhomyces tanzawaensis NRRL Y-17324]ODV78615.1 hypothetical protein CANTADRAFT_90931 [Suhomyces tanzawaensis NRRL Y-17324]